LQPLGAEVIANVHRAFWRFLVIARGLVALVLGRRAQRRRSGCLLLYLVTLVFFSSGLEGGLPDDCI
jgi:hypothetical protein